MENLGSTIFYFHHLNKGNDASGSTMKHRTIDMVIRMRKPDNKQKIKTFEDKGVQAIVDFPKWRLHDNSKYSQEHMLICEDWKWQKLPVLTSDELEIVRMFEEDLTVPEMAKQIDLAEKTIYKKIKKLKDEGVIKMKLVEKQLTQMQKIFTNLYVENFYGKTSLSNTEIAVKAGYSPTVHIKKMNY